MKNFFKLFGIVALAVVIGFSFASCKPSPDGVVDNGISDGTVASEESIHYVSNITNEADAKSHTDFSYFRNWEDNEFKSTYSISEKINAPTTVTVSDSKVNINLGEPKTLWEINNYGDLNTLNNSAGAKIFYCGAFYTQDGKYFLLLGGEKSEVELLYVDKDTKISGQRVWTWVGEEDGKNYKQTATFNASLKKGWNFFIWTLSNTSNNNNTTNYAVTVTASTKIPSGCEWTVRERN